MGCFVSIIKKIIIILLIVAFFMFGGYAFIKEKINNYQNPPRQEFIEKEKNYADFSKVSGDYQLYRSFNFFGFKKINAKYLPTQQKITIFDLKDEDLISVSDFRSGEIDNKIEKFLSKTKDSLITYENFDIVKKGNFNAKNKNIPYIQFSASVKNIPFKDVVGVVCAYSSMNDNQKVSTKLIIYIVDDKAFNYKIIQNFVSSLRF